jgi:hypothetical protein
MGMRAGRTDMHQAALRLKRRRPAILYFPEILSVSDEVLTLMDAYVAHEILSQKFRNDLMHIAPATVCGVDMEMSIFSPESVQEADGENGATWKK